MAIKAGQILHDAAGFVIDRLQTAGASNLNIPQEKIYEVGNYKTVATIRDIPDLSFDMESFDVSTEVEALMTGLDPTTVTNGQAIDFGDVIPLDIISPFKAGGTSFTIVGGVAVPYLTLESATYRFGVGQSSTQQFTMRGDAIYYMTGTPRYKSFTASGTSYAFGETALPYVESGVTQYALSVCLKNPTTHVFKRLFRGVDYTDTASGVTLTGTPDAAYTKLHVVYGTATQDTTKYVQSAHQGVSVKPAAVKGKDIDVYVSDGAATPTYTRWTGVQSFEVNYRVSIDPDEEFGNKHYVAQDYLTPTVSGSIVLKPRDVADFLAKVDQIASTTTAAVTGVYSSVPIGVELRINDPDTGTRLKTLYIDDARFTLPSDAARANTKNTYTFPFESDQGDLVVYRGIRA